MSVKNPISLTKIFDFLQFKNTKELSIESFNNTEKVLIEHEFGILK
jgi:hypothetical protein